MLVTPLSKSTVFTFICVSWTSLLVDCIPGSSELSVQLLSILELFSDFSPFTGGDFPLPLFVSSLPIGILSSVSMARLLAEVGATPSELE